MDCYKEMYNRLFNHMTIAIELMKRSQQECEEMMMAFDEKETGDITKGQTMELHEKFGEKHVNEKDTQKCVSFVGGEGGI